MMSCECGVVCRALFYFIFSIANSTNFALVALGMTLLTGPLLPRTRAMLSNSVPPHMQTKVQSSFAALETIVTSVSPISLAVYASSVSDAPQLCYWLFSALCVCSVSIVVVIITRYQLRRNLPDLDGHLSHAQMGLVSHINNDTPLLVDQQDPTQELHLDVNDLHKKSSGIPSTTKNVLFAAVASSDDHSGDAVRGDGEMDFFDDHGDTVLFRRKISPNNSSLEESIS